MNISDVIEELQEIQNVHGDIRVTADGMYVNGVAFMAAVDGPFADIRVMIAAAFRTPSPLMPAQAALH